MLLSVPVMYHLFQAIFDAKFENGFSGIALDDISVLDGECLGGTYFLSTHTGIKMLYDDKANSLLQENN